MTKLTEILNEETMRKLVVACPPLREDRDICGNNIPAESHEKFIYKLGDSIASGNFYGAISLDII